MNEACGVIFGWGIECRKPAAGRFRRICVHEHVREGPLCEVHATSDLVCQACWDLDGSLSHECPIDVVKLGEALA